MFNAFLSNIYKQPNRLCRGLSANQLAPFTNDKNLLSALSEARIKYNALPKDYKEMIHELNEHQLTKEIQQDFINFYNPDTVSPFVTLSSKGPWMVTTHGGIIYDAGGYGMLGFGHNPVEILDAMAEEQPQANIMTPNFAQLTFSRTLRNEIGHSRPDKKCPFDKFMCLNSGSEVVGLAGRISDAHANVMTGPGGVHEGRRTIFITLEKGFHGRTNMPAALSDSSRSIYKKNLHSYYQWSENRTVKVNDIEALRNEFAKAEAENLHVEMMVMEPVAGEGNPGVACTPEFYAEARKLTLQHHSLLMVDSIQAGLRTRGNLSIVDSQACLDLPCPDFETYSKALTGGQYPLSVLALSNRAANAYKEGLYGNTMTANPRGLKVATAVLNMVTPEVRQNIVEKGIELTDTFKRLQKKYPKVITDVTGTGLLSAAHISPEYPVVGDNSLEQQVRMNGLNVIHGGTNALRFTPWFKTSSDEIKLIEDVLDNTFAKIK